MGLIAVLLWKFPVQQWLLAMVQWIQSQGVVGYLVYVAVYAVGTVILFPGSILTLGAGWAYGVLIGSALVSVASMSGATMAFLIGRYLARDWVTKKVSNNKKFMSIDKAVAKQGFKIVLLTRLSPVFPFTLLNYGYGLTGVSLRDYFFASWIGMIPGTVMYVYFGSLITTITQLTSGETPTGDEGDLLKNVFKFIGLGVTVAVTIIVTRIARNALKEEELA